MIEKIAMWGGFAAIVIAVFAIIILYLTRSNIIDLLDRDVVMYDKNYEAKKEALEQAFKCLDIVASNGADVKANPQFTAQAKSAYNALLCTVNSSKIYQEFYRMAIDQTEFGYTIEDIEKFKISCRNELLSKHKNKGEGFKGVVSGNLNSVMQPQIQPMPTQQQPALRPRPQKPAKPSQPQDAE